MNEKPKLRRELCKRCKDSRPHGAWDSADDYDWYHRGVFFCGYNGNERVEAASIPADCPYAAEHIVRAGEPDEPRPSSLSYSLSKMVCKKCKNRDARNKEYERSRFSGWSPEQESLWREGFVWCLRALAAGEVQGAVSVRSGGIPRCCPFLTEQFASQRAWSVC